jgi:hypothetical protein
MKHQNSNVVKSVTRGKPAGIRAYQEVRPVTRQADVHVMGKYLQKTS